MASDTEASSNLKHIGLDATESEAVYTINELFPKIDNLEYFPVEMLMKVFADCDDIKLLDLANISYRFGGVAKAVFQKRYARKYIVFDPNTEFDPDTEEQHRWFQAFDRFGSHANNIKVLESCQWPAEIDNILSQSKMNITHLQFEKQYHCSSTEFDVEKAEQIFRNNPELKTLILHGFSLKFYDMLLAIAKNLKQLKELDLVGEHNFDDNQREMIPQETINLIVDSLKHLQSLKLTIGKNILGLLQQFGLKCKNIKQLELAYTPNDDSLNVPSLSEIVDVLGRFQSVECLMLSYWFFTYTIELAIGNLPKLRHLHITMNYSGTNSLIFSLIGKCESLETITIDSGGHYHGSRTFLPGRSRTHVNVSFYNELVKTMKHLNGKVEFKNNQELIGYVTKNEIVWRNKLMHWIEYDASYNQSNLNLLDLARKTNAEQQSKCPLDHILEYLDLGSLYTLSKTSKRSKQLVENFVQRHSQRHGTFTITDELCSNGNGLDAFAQHIQNLNVSIYNVKFIKDLATAMDTYKNLNKLEIFLFIHEGIYELVVRLREHKLDPAYRQVRHLIISKSKTKDIWFAAISNIFPELETFEIKMAVNFHQHWSTLKLEVRNLKKFVFKYSDEAQFNGLKDLFKNTDTELIPIM